MSRRPAVTWLWRCSSWSGSPPVCTSSTARLRAGAARARPPRWRGSLGTTEPVRRVGSHTHTRQSPKNRPGAGRRCRTLTVFCHINAAEEEGSWKRGVVLLFPCLWRRALCGLMGRNRLQLLIDALLFKYSWVTSRRNPRVPQPSPSPLSLLFSRLCWFFLTYRFARLDVLRPLTAVKAGRFTTVTRLRWLKMDPRSQKRHESHPWWPHAQPEHRGVTQPRSTTAQADGDNAEASRHQHQTWITAIVIYLFAHVYVWFYKKSDV